MAQWSAYSPSIQTILVRIPLKSTVFLSKFEFEMSENKKESGVGTLLKISLDRTINRMDPTLLLLLKLPPSFLPSNSPNINNINRQCRSFVRSKAFHSLSFYLFTRNHS